MAHFLPFLCFLMMLPQVSGIRQTSEGAERVVCIERSSVFHSAAGMQVLPTLPPDEDSFHGCNLRTLSAFLSVSNG